MLAGHATLLGVSMKQYGREQVHEWLDIAHSAGVTSVGSGGQNAPAQDCGVNVVDLNLMEGWMLRVLRGVLFPGLLQQAPAWLPPDRVLAHLATYTEVCASAPPCRCGSVSACGHVGMTTLLLCLAPRRCCAASWRCTTGCWASCTCWTSTAACAGGACVLLAAVYPAYAAHDCPQSV